MKKKYIIIITILVLADVFCIWRLTRPEVLGNISHASSEAESNVSDITFSGEAGEQIKFSFSSVIESGELSVVIYDSQHNVVKELDRARALETFMIPEYTDTYTLEAEYLDFVGKFKVSVYRMD